jgi:hypothetical protein
LRLEQVTPLQLVLAGTVALLDVIAALKAPILFFQPSPRLAVVAVQHI